MCELQQLVNKIRKCHVCCVIACFFPLVLPCMFYREAHSVMQIGSEDKLLMFALSDPSGAKSSLQSSIKGRLISEFSLIFCRSDAHTVQIWRLPLCSGFNCFYIQSEPLSLCLAALLCHSLCNLLQIFVFKVTARLSRSPESWQLCWGLEFSLESL